MAKPILTFDPDELLTTGPAARLMDVSEAAVVHWANIKRIPIQMRDGCRLFKRSDLETLRVRRAEAKAFLSWGPRRANPRAS